jgi:hypothetical protein
MGSESLCRDAIFNFNYCKRYSERNRCLGLGGPLEEKEKKTYISNMKLNFFFFFCPNCCLIYSHIVHQCSTIAF